MCTVTIIRLEQGFVVTMNRDESKHRPHEIVPTDNSAENWFGPIDSVYGGTWFGVSDKGIVACLLNGYDFEKRKLLPEQKSSRGKIIPEALQFSDANEISTWIKNQNLSSYPSFRLIVSDQKSAREWQWDGVELLQFIHDEDFTICSSSSWKQESVMKFRSSAFSEWKGMGNENRKDMNQMVDSISHHYHHLQKDSMSGPLITRDVSVTRSITQAVIDCTQNQISIRYWPDPRPNAPAQPAVKSVPYRDVERLAKD